MYNKTIIYFKYYLGMQDISYKAKYYFEQQSTKSNINMALRTITRDIKSPLAYIISEIQEWNILTNFERYPSI